MQSNKAFKFLYPKCMLMVLVVVMVVGSFSGLITSTNIVSAAWNTETQNEDSVASRTLDVTTRQLVGDTGPYLTFPQHVPYAEGTIKPNHITQAEMDDTVIRLYKEWKKKYLQVNPYDTTQKFVYYNDENPDAVETDTDALGNEFTFKPLTVSEAHGYGMMITALMAGHDPETQADYDALYHYFRAHPSEHNFELMAWRQGDTGTAIVDVSGPDSATDGDLDIAYSLLLADQQWGSQGTVNYLAEAKKVITAIMDSEVYQTDWSLRIADWATSGQYVGATRPSDFMLQHMKDFAIVSGDARWDQTVSGTYNIINSIFEAYSPKSGLLPDFVVKDVDKFVPASPNFLESEHDGDYYYNSSRTPWRIATDYLVTGDKRAEKQLKALNQWIRTTANNDPEQIFSGYKLDGSSGLQSSAEDEWQDIVFIAPFMVSAMIDSSNQQWLNDLWDYSAALETEDEVYFGNNIRMLSMIVVSGNWWSPSIMNTQALPTPVIDYANALSSHEISLKWITSADNLGVAGYNVYRDDKLIATTTKTEYKDSGLKANTQYAYVITAFDAAGNISQSSDIRLVKTLKVPTSGDSDPVTDPVTDSGKEAEVITEPKEEKEETKLPTLLDISNHWAEKEIKLAIQKGIINGYPNETFRPNHNITRAEFVVILTRIFNLQGKGKSLSFTDEHLMGAWARNAITLASEAGLINGYKDGTFKPNAFISHAEMAMMIANGLGMSEKAESTTGFTDDDQIPAWSRAAVKELRDLGIIKDHVDNKFEAQAMMTRAEAIIVALRLAAQIKEKPSE